MEKVVTNNNNDIYTDEDLLISSYNKPIPFNSFYAQPKDYTGFKSEQDYIQFKRSCLYTYTDFKHHINNQLKFEKRRQEHKRNFADFLSEFETQSLVDKSKPRMGFYISFKLCKKDKDYIIFNGDAVKSFSNHIRIHNHQSDVVKYGIRCKFHEFTKFLLWNLLRCPETWTGIHIEDYSYLTYPIPIVKEFEKIYTVHLLNTILYEVLLKCCFGNSSIHIHPNFKYIYYKDEIDNIKSYRVDYHTNILFESRERSRCMYLKKKEEEEKEEMNKVE